MGHHTAPQRRGVVASFQTAHHAALGPALGHLHELRGDPGIVGLDQAHLAQFVLAMGIETRRDKDDFRLMGIEPGQPLALHQLAHDSAIGKRWHRHIHHIGRRILGARMRIEGVLEEAAHKDTRVIGECGLGAITVMHIEIDHGHPLQTTRQSMTSSHRHIVEEAETHGLIGAGMMAGWTYRAEGIAGLAIDYRINGCHGSARRMASRCQGVRIEQGIGIERMVALTGYGCRDARQVIGRMHPQQRLVTDRRGLTLLQVGQHPHRQQVICDGIEPIRAFGMPAAHFMPAAHGVGVVQSGHRLIMPSPRLLAIGFCMNELIPALRRQLGTVILGKDVPIRLALSCLLAGGHLLLEDLPGVGKTTLAQALARSLGLRFQRVQFTSDLLPADLLGGSIYDRQRGEFQFHAGPVFSELVLADEINRASPKTQGALLEAMEEGQVSIDGHTRALPRPFFVIATQNPLHQIGTFPLPESQLDRFLMSLSLGYPSPEAEKALLAGQDRRALLQQLPALTDGPAVLALQAQVAKVHVSAALIDYVHALLVASRAEAGKAEGLSPRAGLGLLAAARAWAWIDGRDYVMPEDVKAVLPSVARHRLAHAGGSGSDHRQGEAMAAALLRQVAVG